MNMVRLKDRKYRCPTCGEECIPLKDKMFCYCGRKSRYEEEKICGPGCPKCGANYVTNVDYSLSDWIEITVLILAFILMFIVGPIVNMWFSFLGLFLMILDVTLIDSLGSINRSITAYTLEYDKKIIPEPNARLRLYYETKIIRNLGIYGLHFRQSTRNARFHDAFTNDLVPVVFHKERRYQQGELNVRVIKAGFVPEELLSVGSLFDVVDNGEIIAEGIITGVDEIDRSNLPYFLQDNRKI